MTQQPVSHMRRLAATIRRQGSPTEGETAFAFWQASLDAPIDVVARVFKWAGYLPFHGYPLRPNGPARKAA